MKVFEVCCLIIKRHFGAFALYFGIFITLSVVMTSFYTDSYSSDFSAQKPNFTVINRDSDSPLTDGLVAYLSEHGVEVVLDDEKEELQDATFFHATDYIAILPEGFHDAFWSGQPLNIETVTTTESAKGYYADSLVNQYLNLARMYIASSPETDEKTLVTSVIKDLKAEVKVEKKQFKAGAPVNENFQVYSRMMCYIMLVLIILCISNIMQAFRRTEVRMRNLCSPLNPRVMSGQQILCGVVVGIAAWLLMTAVGFIFYGTKLSGTDVRLIALILLNTFIVMLVSLSIASLASQFISGPNAQNAAANFLSLALCFLGGAFVPLEMMGEGLLAVSRFVPTYWYVTALDRICSLNSFSGDALTPIWQAMLIQLAFAAAFLCVTLVISKYQNQSERAFGSVRTELET